MLLAIGFIIVLGIIVYVATNRKSADVTVTAVAEEPEEVEQPKRLDPVKVVVTYLDGTIETFQTKDGEVDLMDDGTITFRTEDARCITLSPKNYRKLEEVHIS